MNRPGFFPSALLAAVALCALAGCPEEECAYYNDCDDDFVCREGRCVERDDRTPTYTGEGDGGISTPTGSGDGGTIVGLDAGPTAPSCDAGACCDYDEDGFIFCNQTDYPEGSGEPDCDDNAWHIQPGGYEYPANGTDDNCNGLTDAEESPPCGCHNTNAQSPEVQSPEHILHAMDICDETLGSVRVDGDPQQFGIFGNFFTPDISPRQGNCLVVLSTGKARPDCETTPAGCLDVSVDGSSFADPSSDDMNFADPTPPVPDGGTLADPHQGGTTIFDLARVHFEVTPPVNAKGLELEFMFISKEWPDYLCTQFNDTFYVVAEIAGLNGGAPSNIAFNPENQLPVTVNVGYFELPAEWSVALGETPYGQPSGSGYCPSPIEGCTLPSYCSGSYDLGYEGSTSGWIKARAPVPPGGDPVQITLSIHDEGDGIFDSMVVLDRFRWLPTAPTVGAYKPPPSDVVGVPTD